VIDMAVSNHLLRDLAPIPVKAWKIIDDEARQRLTPLLAARRVTDWSGPGGWEHDRYSLGRTTALSGPPPGADVTRVRTLQRRVLAVAEVRVSFTVSRHEIDDMQRGAMDNELDDLDRAAREAAIVENRAVFHGWPAAGITGMTQCSAYDPVALGDECTGYPTTLAVAVDRMRQAGVEGPYALAISPQRYTRIAETTEHGGYPLIDHLSRILDGKVIWSPGVDGAVLVSQRGGDFTLDVGQDWSVGYSSHDDESVILYLEESFTFWPTEQDACLTLT
jgi:uncharacterized linocin/CFP29 family protein